MPANFQKSAMHLIDYILINCCNAKWEFLIFLWRSMKYLDSNTFGKGQARWSSCMQWSNPKKHLEKQRLPFEDCMQWWYNLITFQREGVFGSESVMRLFDKNHGWSVTWRRVCKSCGVYKKRNCGTAAELSERVEVGQEERKDFRKEQNKEMKK